MLVKRLICIYPSIFNCFPVIQAWCLKILNSSTFFHILASPVYAPRTIAVNVTWIEREFSACHLSLQHVRIYLQHSCHISINWVEWVELRTFTAIVQGAYTVRPKCAKNVLKWRIFKLQAWVTWKQLKIDGYIQRGVLQALNPLSNSVTFTAIAPGAYTGEAKIFKKCAKMANF